MFSSFELSTVKMLYVLFNAPINNQSVKNLIAVVSQAINDEVKELTMLFNSPGGSVPSGITARNFLQVTQLKKIFWNIGNIDSIGVPIFLAGDERYCVPHARFLLHDIKRMFNGQSMLSETDISIMVPTMQQDRNAIANLIGESTGQKSETIISMMKQGTILSSKEARRLGFIQEEKRFQLPANAKLVTICE